MRGYEERLQRVAVAGGADLHICTLFDRQQYADLDGAAEAAGTSPANWPLFGQLWPSALKLADPLQSWMLGERRKREIGCGLALASVVIHRRGGNVTSSDCHPRTETFLRSNLKLNELPDLQYRTGHWQRANSLLGCLGLIVGSDLLYERSPPEQRAAFVQVHASPQAEVLTGRSESRQPQRVPSRHGAAGFLADGNTPRQAPCRRQPIPRSTAALAPSAPPVIAGAITSRKVQRHR
jgi:hypothetical protein